MQLLSCDLWLMERSAFRQFTSFTSTGFTVDAEKARASAPQSSRQKTVALIPISGALEARSTFFGEMFGMMSYEKIGKSFSAAVQDDSVATIILDVSSPGGMVYGAQELADKIYRARGTKPIIAVANPMAASGAFWLAAAADRLIVTPSGDVGSVGVIMEHYNITASLEKDGTKATIIRSSKSPHKAEANDVEPLTDEAKANLQLRADTIYSKFAGDLAKFRGVSVDHVEEHFGKGRLVDSKSAIHAGMADRIGTLDEIIEKALAGRIRITTERAENEFDAPTKRERYKQRVESIKAMASAGPMTLNECRKYEGHDPLGGTAVSEVVE